MGLQMALRLHQHLSKQGQGRKLIAWNRTLSKADPLKQQGALTVANAAGQAVCTLMHRRAASDAHTYAGKVCSYTVVVHI